MAGQSFTFEPGSLGSTSTNQLLDQGWIYFLRKYFDASFFVHNGSHFHFLALFAWKKFEMA
jgi:hypothetical protein